MNYLLRTLFVSMIALGVGASGLACEVNVGDKDKDEDSDDDKKKKKKKASKDDDEEEEIDVASLLADSSDSSGVLSKTDLKGIDTSKAPRLGKRSAKSEGLKDAQWLTLPGGTLQIPNPKGWKKEKPNADFGLIGSPDEKSMILFTTYETEEQLKKLLDGLGEKLEINNVDWKKPHDVKLGQDSIPAVVRGGKLTTAKGEKGSILFALVETGVPKKVLALALAEDDVSKKIKDQTLNIILATRKKR